jgi:hypothetical protein
MEQAPAPPTPPQGPEAAAPAGSAPATRDDVRWLGRWLVVVAIWAAAASAVAILALVDARSQESDKSRTARLERRLDGLQQDLVARTGRLQSQLRGLPRSQDVTRLDKRLAKVEDNASKASADAKKASAKLSDLESRVKSLESSSKSGTSTTPKKP